MAGWLCGQGRQEEGPWRGGGTGCAATTRTPPLSCGCLVAPAWVGNQPPQRRVNRRLHFPHYCCRALQTKFTVVALLTTVLVWARYQQSASLAGATLGSGAAEGRTLAGSRSSSGRDEPEPGAAGTILLPLDDAYTLQFDVCNGFTNQRIALMSGGQPARPAQPALN